MVSGSDKNLNTKNCGFEWQYHKQWNGTLPRKSGTEKPVHFRFDAHNVSTASLVDCIVRSRLIANSIDPRATDEKINGARRIESRTQIYLWIYGSQFRAYLFYLSTQRRAGEWSRDGRTNIVISFISRPSIHPMAGRMNWNTWNAHTHRVRISNYYRYMHFLCSVTFGIHIIMPFLVYTIYEWSLRFGALFRFWLSLCFAGRRQRGNDLRCRNSVTFRSYNELPRPNINQGLYFSIHTFLWNASYIFFFWTPVTFHGQPFLDEWLRSCIAFECIARIWCSRWAYALRMHSASIWFYWNVHWFVKFFHRLYVALPVLCLRSCRNNRLNANLSPSSPKFSSI